VNARAWVFASSGRLRAPWRILVFLAATYFCGLVASLLLAPLLAAFFSFVHPEDRPVVEEARQKRALQVRAEYLTEMRKKAGMTQAEVAEAMGVSQQRVSAIESGSVAELATLADYIHALGGELKVIADFGDSWRRVA